MLKKTVKWLLIISALMSVFSIVGLIIAPTTSATQEEIDDCQSGERTPEEMGYGGMDCYDMGSGVMKNTMLNWMRVLGCLTCVPAALILGVIYPFIKTPDPDGIIAAKEQKLAEFTKKYNENMASLKSAQQRLDEANKLQMQRNREVERDAQILEQRIQNMTGGEAELVTLQESLARGRNEVKRLKEEAETAQKDAEKAQKDADNAMEEIEGTRQAMETLRAAGIHGTNITTYNIQNSKDVTISGRDSNIAHQSNINTGDGDQANEGTYNQDD